MDFGLYIYFEKSIMWNIPDIHTWKMYEYTSTCSYYRRKKSFTFYLTFANPQDNITQRVWVYAWVVPVLSFWNVLTFYQYERSKSSRQAKVNLGQNRFEKMYCVYFLVKSSTYLCKILVIYFIKKAFMEKHAWKENNNFSNQLFVIITSHYNDEDKKLISKLSVILFSSMVFS